MMNLAEYRRRSQSLADFLPWAALVEHGVILNKDGSFSGLRAFVGLISTPHCRRARGHHVTPQQCAAPAGIGLGDLRRSPARPGQPLS